MTDLMPPVVTTTEMEYELRYGDDTEPDLFDDLEAALAQQDWRWRSGKPEGQLFRRTVTTVVVNGEWEPVTPTSGEAIT